MAERITLVNKYGEPQSESIFRSEVPLHKREGLYVEAVTAVVINGLGEVLVHRRAKGKTHEGCYDHVCGAVQTDESRESPDAAVLREIKEEYGIEDIQSLSYVLSGVNVNDIYRHLFLAVTLEEPRIISRREVASIHILDREELESMRQDGEPFIDGFFDDLNAVYY